MALFNLGEEYEARLKAYEDSLRRYEAPSLFGRLETVVATARSDPISFFINYPISKQEHNERIRQYEDNLREFGYIPAREKIKNAAKKVKAGAVYTGIGIATIYGFGKKAAGYTRKKIKQGYNYAAPRIAKTWADSKPTREELGRELVIGGKELGKFAQETYSELKPVAITYGNQIKDAITNYYLTKKEERFEKKEAKRKSRDLAEKLLLGGTFTQDKRKPYTFEDARYNLNKKEASKDISLTRSTYQVDEINPTKNLAEKLLVNNQITFEKTREPYTFEDSRFNLLPEEERPINFSTGEYHVKETGKPGSSRDLVEKMLIDKRIHTEEF